MVKHKQKGLNMEDFLNTTVIAPKGLYATPKDQFIEEQLKVISDMEKQIAELEQKKMFLEPGSFEYRHCQKRIARRYAIIRDCKSGIFHMVDNYNIND